MDLEPIAVHLDAHGLMVPRSRTFPVDAAQEYDRLADPTGASIENRGVGVGPGSFRIARRIGDRTRRGDKRQHRRHLAGPGQLALKGSGGARIELLADLWRRLE